MQYAIEKDIELITFGKARRGGNHPKHTEAVWLEKKAHKETGKEQYYAVRFSEDLVEAAAWQAGDTVMLGRVKGANIWVFVPNQRPDAFVLRKKPAGTLGIGNQQLARELHAITKAEEFDAWADDCAIYFKPKKGVDA